MKVEIKVILGEREFISTQDASQEELEELRKMLDLIENGVEHLTISCDDGFQYSFGKSVRNKIVFGIKVYEA